MIDVKNLPLKVGALYKIVKWEKNYHLNLKEPYKTWLGICTCSREYTAHFLTKDKKIDTWTGDKFTYERLDNED